MNEFQGNIYRCPNCTRVTTNYPFGCRNKPCPVKKDMLWDMTYGSFVSLVFIFMVGLGTYLLFTNFAKEDKKVLDYYSFPGYNINNNRR